MNGNHPIALPVLRDVPFWLLSSASLSSTVHPSSLLCIPLCPRVSLLATESPYVSLSLPTSSASPLCLPASSLCPLASPFCLLVSSLHHCHLPCLVPAFTPSVSMIFVLVSASSGEASGTVQPRTHLHLCPPACQPLQELPAW